jgi:Glycyl-tRNA synthetase alpha subunit
MLAVVQFTYFQQAGGRLLPIPAMEITYGPGAHPHGPAGGFDAGYLTTQDTCQM